MEGNPASLMGETEKKDGECMCEQAEDGRSGGVKLQRTVMEVLGEDLCWSSWQVKTHSPGSANKLEVNQQGNNYHLQNLNIKNAQKEI